MKTKIVFFSLLMSINMSWGQTANFNIDGTQYVVSKGSENQTIDASWRLDRLQFVFKTESPNRKGKYDNLTLETVGREIKSYPIGIEVKKIVDKTGSENGCGSISVNWFEGLDRKSKSSDTGYEENSTGFIKISKVEGNKVSGSFQATIDGTIVSGSFENVEVKSW